VQAASIVESYSYSRVIFNVYTFEKHYNDVRIDTEEILYCKTISVYFLIQIKLVLKYHTVRTVL
jgi:hypothetical protein